MNFRIRGIAQLLVGVLIPIFALVLNGCGDSSSTPKKSGTTTKSTAKSKTTKDTKTGTTGDATADAAAKSGAQTPTGSATNPANPGVTVGGVQPATAATGAAGTLGAGAMPAGGFPAIPNGQGGMEINNYWNLLSQGDKDLFMKCITGNGAIVAGTNNPLAQSCITQASNSVQSRLLGPILQMYGNGALPPGGLGGTAPAAPAAGAGTVP